jgi:two-component system chemotaxis sensor kinase CheA
MDPGLPLPHTTSLETQWVRDDTASVVETCDKVFGVVSVALALAAIGCWLFDRASLLTAGLVLAFPLANLAISKIGARNRVASEAVRLVVSTPLCVAIYVESDGPLHNMWLPLLIMVAGGALIYTVLGRDARYGYGLTFYYTALLGLAEALSVSSDATLVLWRCLALLVVGVVLSTIVGKLGVTVVEARVKRHEAELHKRDLERSLLELDERNRGMRLVLDNVAQGFITVDLDGVMASERSAIVDRWFGAPEAGATFASLLARESPEQAAWFELGIEGLRDGFMPAELCLEQMPRRLVARGRTLEIKYSPLRDEEKLRVLCIVSDVTDHIVRERAEREQRETVALFQHLTADRAGFDEFLEDAGAMVASFSVAGDPIVERRTVHTLKGNAAIYGLEGFSELCHQIESELHESGGSPSPEQRGVLGEAWRDVTSRVTRLCGGTRRNVVEVEYPELTSAVAKVKEGMPSRDLAALLSSWAYEPAGRRFDRLGRYARSLAQRLGKGDIDVSVAATGVRLEPSRWASFWSALVHAVRNAVDHGIEAPPERARSGLSTPPRLELAASRGPGTLTISISDDGGGIAWERVRQRAHALGLPAETHADLEHALFADGLSTRGEVTDTSGRGVGMAALRAAVEELGGRILVADRPTRGTTVSCVFPERASALPSVLPTRPPVAYAAGCM